MTSHVTSPHLAHQSHVEPVISLLRSSKLVAKNWSTCLNWKLSVPHQVTGRLPYIWSLKRPTATGDLVVTTEPWTTSPFQIVFPYHTSRTFLLPPMVSKCFPKLTLWEPTIKYQYTLMTSPKPLQQPPLVSSSSCECPLGYKMLWRHSEDLWTKSYVV